MTLQFTSKWRDYELSIRIVCGDSKRYLVPMDGEQSEASFESISCITKFQNAIYIADNSIRESEHITSIRKLCDGKVTTVVGPEWLTGPFANVHMRSATEMVVEKDQTLVIVDSDSESRRRIRRFDFVAQKITEFEQVPEDTFLTVDNQRNVCFQHILNEDEIWKLELGWQVERLLWIGQLKEHPSACFLAVLPRELVTEIVRWYWCGTPTAYEGL